MCYTIVKFAKNRNVQLKTKKTCFRNRYSGIYHNTVGHRVIVIAYTQTALKCFLTLHKSNKTYWRVKSCECATHNRHIQAASISNKPLHRPQQQLKRCLIPQTQNETLWSKFMCGCINTRIKPKPRAAVPVTTSVTSAPHWTFTGSLEPGEDFHFLIPWLCLLGNGPVFEQSWINV